MSDADYCKRGESNGHDELCKFGILGCFLPFLCVLKDVYYIVQVSHGTVLIQGADGKVFGRRRPRRIGILSESEPLLAKSTGKVT